MKYLKMNLYYKPMGHVETTKQKIIVILCAILIGLAVVVSGVFFTQKWKRYTVARVKKDPAIVIGEVVHLKTYKSKGADIEYSVNGKTYVLKTGITTEMYEKLEDGSDVEVAYLRSDPSVAVLAEELNGEFSLLGGFRATGSTSRRKLSSPTK